MIASHLPEAKSTGIPHCRLRALIFIIISMAISATSADRNAIVAHTFKLDIGGYADN
jgi:hypothetical protein